MLKDDVAIEFQPGLTLVTEVTIPKFEFLDGPLGEGGHQNCLTRTHVLRNLLGAVPALPDIELCSGQAKVLAKLFQPLRRCIFPISIPPRAAVGPRWTRFALYNVGFDLVEILHYAAFLTLIAERMTAP